MSDPQKGQKESPDTDHSRLDELFRQLSAGEISRRAFEEATGQEWWWGDILEGLGKRNLPYPVVEPKRTDAQPKLADAVLIEIWERDNSSFGYLNLVMEECQSVSSSTAGSSTESELTPALLVTISDQTSSREIFPRFANPSIKARVERTCV